MELAFLILLIAGVVTVTPEISFKKVVENPPSRTCVMTKTRQVAPRAPAANSFLDGSAQGDGQRGEAVHEQTRAPGQLVRRHREA